MSDQRREPHIYTRAHDPKPIVFLPEMKRPCDPVEKGHAAYMRELLERTCAELRLPPCR